MTKTLSHLLTTSKFVVYSNSVDLLQKRTFLIFALDKYAYVEIERAA